MHSSENIISLDEKSFRYKLKQGNLLVRIINKYQTMVSSLCYRRPFKMQNKTPYISFTFDDFPNSALHKGGSILMRFGFKATYYASFGLMGTEGPSGKIFDLGDIKELLSLEHEIGCHTFAHCHSMETDSRTFEDSIIKNRNTLNELIPGACFKSFSFPISGPLADTKRRAGRYFTCCRGGGQAFNSGKIDLNLLNAYFLEKSRDKPQIVKEFIDRCCQSLGWLIFVTHDISENPTQYGCTPSFFEEIVTYCNDSGARILPVGKALEKIFGESKTTN
jgi:peptidoglycan/xylan/chitin deacetylase (PgdA/CDA1 family)